jgi:wnt family
MTSRVQTAATDVVRMRWRIIRMPPHRLRAVIPASSHRIRRSFMNVKPADSATFVLVFLLVSASIWYTADGLNAALVCDRIQGLSPRQRQLCRAYPDAMAATGNGLSLALAECQFQFQFERWNCTGTTFGSNNSTTEATLVGECFFKYIHAFTQTHICMYIMCMYLNILQKTLRWVTIHAVLYRIHLHYQM